MKKYTIDNTEHFASLMGNEAEWPSPFVLIAAGFSPDDEEISASSLSHDWNGHKAGDVVVHGLNASGHPFAVLTVEEAEDWRKAAYSVVSRQKGRVYEVVVRGDMGEQELSGEYFLELTLTGRMGGCPAGVACWSEAEGYTWSREAPGPGRFVRWN